MGYSTHYEGVLKFTCEMNGNDFARLSSYLGEDVKHHPEWGVEGGLGYEYYIKLELADDFSGVQWDESEKTDGMVEVINFLIDEMRKTKPDFGFEGEMLAQGEDVGDVWRLVIVDGRAKAVDVILKKEDIVCPNCGYRHEMQD